VDLGYELSKVANFVCHFDNCSTFTSFLLLTSPIHSVATVQLFCSAGHRQVFYGRYFPVLASILKYALGCKPACLSMLWPFCTFGGSPVHNLGPCCRPNVCWGYYVLVLTLRNLNGLRLICSYLNLEGSQWVKADSVSVPRGNSIETV
jgi:hypothetical protein